MASSISVVVVGVPGAGREGLVWLGWMVMLGAGPSREARRRLFLPRAIFAECTVSWVCWI